MIPAVSRSDPSCGSWGCEDLCQLIERIVESVQYFFEKVVSSLQGFFAQNRSSSARSVAPVSAPTTRTSLLTFYRGNGLDQSGRDFDFILNQDDAWLESSHDYIQWLFPTAQRSQYNLHAPQLTPEVAQVFADSVPLQDRMLRAFDRMLRFYGFQRRDEEIVLAPNAGEKQRNWLTPGNHNLLRISRILSSLRACGISETLRNNFYEQLMALRATHSWLASAASHWARAHSA